MKKWIALIVILGVTGAAAYWFLWKGSAPRTHAPIPVGANTDLAKHSEIFKPGVEKVADNLYVAIGYGIANSIMIEGEDGLIIVDTMTTNEEARQVLAEFRKISAKPIKAIIYTHSHPDHVFGSQVFAAEGSPTVYAHDTTAGIVRHLITEVRPIISARSMRMYGNFLSEGTVLNVGIGPFVGMKPGSTVGFVQPTRTFSDTLEDEVAGIRFKLIHVGGETNDQIIVWLPDSKVLIPADDFYWAFPNLYTIRGTPFRSLKNWYRSLDMMRDLKAEHLAPCHTRPIEGAERIYKILTDYRDAIQYVHDQSLRGINLGLTPDELAEFVQLPPHLAKAPYLQPFYGKVSWSVRSMFVGNLGWFSGDSADLQPLGPRDEAKMIADLAGGPDKLAAQARKLLDQGQYQAALQLTTYVIQLQRENAEARGVRIKALTALAEKEQNPNARHYYLSEALELRDGFVVHELSTASPDLLKSFTLADFFDSMAVNLDPRAAADINQTVGMLFPDAGEAFTIHVRHGVAEIRPRKPGQLAGLNPDILVTADSLVWKSVLAGATSPLKALAKFSYDKGNAISFGRFMALFKPGQMKLPCESWRDTL